MVTTMMMNELAILGLPGGLELVVVLLLGLLLFGRRLPDVARSLGKSVVEFKRGLKDIKDEVGDSNQFDDNHSLESKDNNSLPSSGGSSEVDNNSDKVESNNR